MGSIIEIVIMCVFAAVCLTISCFQFREKALYLTMRIFLPIKKNERRWISDLITDNPQL